MLEMGETETTLPVPSSRRRSSGIRQFARWFWHGRGGRKPWLRRTIAIAFAFLLLYPLALTLLYRVMPPPGTPLILSILITEGGADYRWVPLSRMSASLVKAVIASEDGKFCSHTGFDWDAIDRAFENNANGGRLRGGSTISQQTAKNIFMPESRTMVRKAYEAYGTILIEFIWPKWRVMETYLNVAEMGPGIFGVEAAAQHYFKKPASRITPFEAARLTAILPNPRNYRVIGPGPYIQRRTGQIQRLMGGVTRDRLDACVTRYR